MGGVVYEQWPNEGNREFNDAKMRYRDGLPFVMKGVNHLFRSGEKVGVLGLTRSSRSSLIIALLWVVEIVDGKIIGDGVYLASVGLNDIQKRMTIIPHDQEMLSGTIRHEFRMP